MDIKETYNKIAEDWDREHTSDTWWISGTDKFISLFKKDDLILDIGCGAGWKTKYLTERGLKVIGMDISENMLRLAKKRNPSSEFIIGDMRKEIKTNKKFDGIFAQASLLHISKKDLANTLKNILKVLKKNGFLYIAVKELRGREKEEKIIEREASGKKYKMFFSYFKKEELEKYLRDLKMKIIWSEIIKCERRNWIQVIAKK